ncbi:MAG: N-acetyltransferase [Rhodospirillales bacterium]|nr:N-acetyltransferase [Rhodospirillales bacterium]
MFTTCAVPECTDKVALLGPLAVTSDRQRQGVGTALVYAGLERLEHDGAARVYVLGDPGYYGRFGFVPEADVDPPYTLASEWRFAWQSKRLRAFGSVCQGTLSVPRAWLQPNLWAP